jgi:hypothetical protein
MLKASTILLLVLSIVAGAYTIVDFAAPWGTVDGDYRALTGRGYAESSDAGGVTVAVLYLRHMSVNALTAVIATLFILLAGFRQGERWAWWAMLATGLLAWGFGTGVNVAIGNAFDATAHAVGLVWLLVAVLLPLRSFFPHKA